MLRLAIAFLVAITLATPAQAIDTLRERSLIEINADDGQPCSDYTGGELQEGCEYGPGSFMPDWAGESEYGPGDREGGVPSDGFDCFDYYQWYWDTNGCG